MVKEFRDAAGDSKHGAFQRWRGKHREGFFLTLATKRRANLHSAVGCWHIGGYALSAEEAGGSLTRAAKVCADDPLRLIEWAAARDVAVKPCAHCIDRDAFDELAAMAQTKDPNPPEPIGSAIEGRAKEALTISRSRSGALRQSALDRARGICESCERDFSQVLGGLGLRALEVHHREQLRLYEIPRATSVADLAVLCANCHAIVHADPNQTMSVEQIRSMHKGAQLRATRAPRAPTASR
jgi:hypothetical protein